MTASPPRSTLIDPAFLFRFEINLRQTAVRWSDTGLELPESHRLPSFGELAGRPVFADVRVGWSADGIAIDVRVSGKRQVPWCRINRADDSDGFQLWIDTRCSPGIHRATQYCHRFLWMPSGAEANRERPVATWLPIHRARSQPKPVPEGSLRVAAVSRHDGYRLSGFVPAAALTGFDPRGQPRLGFYYAVIDRELGWQTFALGPEYPVLEDPSLWGQAVLLASS